MHREIFISHRTQDTIAHRLHALIRDQLFQGDEAETNRHVFFSGNGVSGLALGERFDRILADLQAARRVVAVVTPEANTAVHVEMAHAQLRDTLVPLIPRPTYRSLLTWPFDDTHAVSLDDPRQVKLLLETLAKDVQPPVVLAKDADDACAEFARRTKEEYPDPSPPERKWQLATAVLAPLVLAGILGGTVAGVAWARRTGDAPVTAVIGSGRPASIDGAEFTLVFDETLPQKLVSNRLHEIRSALVKQPNVTENDKGTSVPAELLMRAIRATDDRWGMGPRLPELAQVLEQWDGRASGEATGGGKPCHELTRDLDRNWCLKLLELMPDARQRNEFDKMEFAVVLTRAPTLGHSLEVVTPGSQLPGATRWKVDNIGAVSVVRVR